MRDERGEPLEIVGFWIDITKRKETEEALRQSDQNLRSMIEGSSDGIVVVTEGQIVFSNSAAAKMLGPGIDLLNRTSAGSGYDALLITCSILFVLGAAILMPLKVASSGEPYPAGFPEEAG